MYHHHHATFESGQAEHRLMIRRAELLAHLIGDLDLTRPRRADSRRASRRQRRRDATTPSDDATRGVES